MIWGGNSVRILGALFALVQTSAWGAYVAPKEVLSPALDQFFSEVESRLPLSMRKQLPAQIEVRFANLPSRVYGRLEPSLFSPPVVVLSTLFRRTILANDFTSPAPLQNRHQTMLRFAVATLLHETAHYFDEFTALNNRAEARTRELCREEQDPRQRRILCKQAAPFRLAVSTRSDFIAAAKYSPNLLIPSIAQTRNFQTQGSVDTYEQTNAAEAFAVNFEFFLLDPQFACRKPVLYSFFQSRFGHTPFENPNCRATWMAQVHSPTSLVEDARISPYESLDPSRVFEVHLLTAGPGTALMSRWGHSMFRVIRCAPHRKQVGPECLNDLPFHLILSFRANVDDLIINNWKGLTGGYPSQLFVISMIDVIREYTRTELRDLESIPLRFSAAERVRFLQSALEHHWQYRGKYGFLTVNCATESYWLVRSALWGSRLSPTDAPITPLGLQELLQSSGLLDAERAIRFASHEANLVAAYQHLRTYGGLRYSSYEEFLSLDPSKQRQHFEALIDTHPSQARKLAANFFILGSHGQAAASAKGIAEASRKIENRGGIEVVAKQLPSLAHWVERALGKSASFWDNTQDDVYGIPLQDELELTVPQAGGQTVSPTQIRLALQELGLNSTVESLYLGAQNLNRYLEVMKRGKK